MKATIRSAAAALLLLASGLQHVHATDLMDIYQLGLERDAQFAAAQSQYQAALEAKPQARAPLLPQADASAGYGRTKREFDELPGDVAQFQRGDTFTTRQFSVSVNQSLFDWDLWVGLGQAEKQIAQARAELESARQDLILRVAEAYFNVLGAQDDVRFREAEKKAIGRQLEQAEKRFEVGLIAVTDVKEAQADYDLAVAEVISARNRLDTAREQLQVVTDQYFKNLNGLSDAFKLVRPEPDDISAWRDKALDNNTQLLAARYGAEVSADQIKRERAGRYPIVGLEARHSINEQDGGGFSEGQTTDSSVQVQVSVPLSTGGAVSSRVREAQENFQQAQDNVELRRRQAISQARNSYLTVLSDISRVEALEQAVESTRTASEATEAGFEVGTRTSVDVLLALRDQFRAERDYAQARYDYLLSTLRLKQAAGTLSGADLRQLNAWIK